MVRKHRMGLPPLPPEMRPSGSRMYFVSLLGLFMPVIGHLVPAYLVYRSSSDDVFLSYHWRHHKADQIAMGLITLVAYAFVFEFGLKCMPIALAVVIPWSIALVVMSAHAEEGKPLRRIWFYALPF